MPAKLKLASVIMAAMITVACGGSGGSGSSGGQGTPDNSNAGGTTDNGQQGNNNGGNNGSNNNDNNNDNAAGLSSMLLFSATGDINQGAELWISDGTEAGTVLVKDINDAGSSTPHSFVKAGNQYFFVATTATNGKELWKTDGTEAGTVLVKDIHPSDDSNPRLLTAMGDKLIFNATDDAGQGIWISDGTADGTVKVTHGDTGIQPGSPAEMVSFNNKVYFSAPTPGNRSNELWETDGTAAGTRMIRINQNRHPLPAEAQAGFIPPFVSAKPSKLVASESNLYFFAFDGDISVQFPSTFRLDTDGNFHKLGSDNNQTELELVSFSETRTGIVNNQRFGGGDITGYFSGSNFARRAVTSFNSQALRPYELTAFGDKLLFVIDSADRAGEELFITTGLFNGTKRVRDIHQGNNSSSIRDINVLDDIAVLVARDGANGNRDQLWVTNGEESGTLKINDTALNMQQFKEFDGKLFFTASNGTNGQELWVTDGTFSGTKMLKDIRTGSDSSAPMLIGEPLINLDARK